MPRFVILRHEPPADSRRPLHWDLMLETGDVLRTWALAEEPAAGRSLAAEALADHRLRYLDYEGPVSGGRGAVTRWDFGTYQLESETSGEIVARLDGQRLSGNLRLTRPDEHSPAWQCELRPGSTTSFSGGPNRSLDGPA